MTKMNQAQNNHTAAPSPQAQFLCADCSGPAVNDRNDPAFGLCGHCENRLNSRESKNKIPSLRGNSEGIGKEVPLSRAVDPERKTFATSGQTDHTSYPTT